MKQIQVISSCIFIVFLIISGSCKKKEICINLTANEWEVVKIKKEGASSYTKAKNSYVLKFTSKQTYSINLDVNECFGAYENRSCGNILIEPMGCTEVCCDTEFAQSLSILLPEMNQYYIIGDELILEGEGVIMLKEI